MKIKALLLIAALAWTGATLPAGDPPYGTHDELTAAWRAEDYRTTLLPGRECDICATEDVPVFTPEGCARHFPGESRGVCVSCLTSPEMAEALNKGVTHSHLLADGTTHSCTQAPLDILAFLQAQAEASPLGDTNAELRSARRRLKQARSRSQIRQLSQKVRALEARRVELAAQDPTAWMAPWAQDLRRSMKAKAVAKTGLDALPHLCRTCGKYPPVLRDFAEKLRGLPVLWAVVCPGCATLGSFTRVDTCSKSTCGRCLERSGEATRYCVVCRQTERGARLVFPGKPGMVHGVECVDLMRKHQDDPGSVGSFDVCEGHDGPGEYREETKGDDKSSPAS